MSKRILAAALGAALCVAGPADAGKRDDTLRIAANQVPESLDSYMNNVRIGVIITHHIWDHLIYRDPRTNEYKPSLATGWKWVDDKTLELELRRGVRFHDGEAFDADDVVYTLNFVANPANKVVTQQNVNWIEKAEKLEPFKVRVRPRQPFPAALEYLAGPVVIYPNEYYAKVGPKGMSEKPVGSGPYKRRRASARPAGAFRAERRLLQGQPAAAADDREARAPPDPGPEHPGRRADGQGPRLDLQRPARPGGAAEGRAAT